MQLFCKDPSSIKQWTRFKDGGKPPTSPAKTLDKERTGTSWRALFGSPFYSQSSGGNWHVRLNMTCPKDTIVYYRQPAFLFFPWRAHDHLTSALINDFSMGSVPMHRASRPRLAERRAPRPWRPVHWHKNQPQLDNIACKRGWTSRVLYRVFGLALINYQTTRGKFSNKKHPCGFCGRVAHLTNFLLL